jgi:ribosomal protein S18 acetylase RimI-like enzyme
MENISIVKGNPMSDIGGSLNCMALDYMAYPLAGTRDSNIIDKTFRQLWRLDLNRFSHQFAYEAKIDEKTVGMITCYPVTVMNKLAWPTTKKLIKIRKLDLIVHSILNFKNLWSMVSLNEGRTDEFHIGTLATLPESRGYGIGSKLIAFAEKQAVLHHYKKISLTVKKDNKQAMKLYDRLGFQLSDFIDKEPYSLYRMVKAI